MSDPTRRGLLGSVIVAGSYLVYGETSGNGGGGGGGGGGNIVENLATVTDGVDQVGWQSATFLGRLEIMEGTSYAEASFEFRPAGAEEVEVTSTERLEDLGDFSRAVSDLMPDTEYEVRAVVESASAYDEGSWVTFSTEAKPNIEVVTTNGVEEIGQTEARVFGEVIEMTNIDEARAYFEYRPTTDLEYQDSEGILIQSPQAYDELLTGLEPDTEYEARARADATQGDWTDNGEIVTWTTKAAIPDSVVGHWPGDEGSGSTLTDTVGNNDITLAGATWVSESAFTGGYGINFDGTGDQASGSLRQPSEWTWMIRVRAGSLGNSSPYYRAVIAHEHTPFLVYDVNNEMWRFQDDDGLAADVSEAQSSVEGAIRILVMRVDSSDATLEVYDNGENLQGSASISNPATTYSGSATNVGTWHDGSRSWVGEMDPQIYHADSYLTDQQVSDLLAEQY